MGMCVLRLVSLRAHFKISFKGHQFEEPRFLYGWFVSVQETGLARAARRSCENLHGRKTVRADRRLRTDDKAIRTQAAICEEPVFLILKQLTKRKPA